MGKLDWIKEVAGKLLPGRSAKSAVSTAAGLWNIRNLAIAIVVLILIVALIIALPKIIADWIVEENKEFFCEHNNLNFSIKKYDYEAMTVRYGCHGCNSKFYAPMTYTENVIKETSCTGPGEIEKVYTVEGLSELNKTVKEKIPQLPHTYEVIEKGFAPTCEQNGLTDYTKCTVCGWHFEATEIAALGHTEAVLIHYKAPTCTEEGNKAKVQCAVCEKILSENLRIPTVEHKYERHSTVAPTDYEAGYDLHECIWCDASYQDNFVSALKQTLNFSETATYCTLISVSTESDVLVIPEYFNGKPVTDLSFRAISNNESIEKIIFPSTLISIRTEGISNLKNLKEIQFSEGIKTIETGAFVACPSIEELIFPASLESTGANCFPDSHNITKVWFAENSEPIVHNYYFSSAIISLKLPKSASVSGLNYATDNLPFLSEIYMSEDLKSKATESALAGIEVKTDYSLESSVIKDGGNYYSKIGGEYYLVAALGSEKALVLPERINGEEYSLRKNSLSRVAKNLESLTVYSTKTSMLDAVGDSNKTCLTGGGITVIIYAEEIKSGFLSFCYGDVILKSSVKHIDTQMDLTRDIFYEGTKEECSAITYVRYYQIPTIVNGSMEYVDASEIIEWNADYCGTYYYSEQEPAEDGKFWHYDENGNPKKW